MKTSILVLICLAIGSQLFGQEPFERLLKSNLDSLNCQLEQGDVSRAVTEFERIAITHPQRWEAYYYIAYGCCKQSLAESEKSKKEALCTTAQTALDEAMALAPKESELFVIQGFVYNARLLVNPMTLGMLYMSKIHAAYDKAMELNPDNPRAYYMKGLMVKHTPGIAGGGKSRALPLLQEAIQKYQNEQVKSEIAPHWGEEECEKQMADCLE